jgi:hypothetical protein
MISVRTRRQRRAATATAAGVTAALVALATGGCAGGNGTTGTATTNGLEKKAPAEIQLVAAALLKTATSVHVTGPSQRSDGSPVRLDLRFQDGSRTGVITLAGARSEVTVVGTDIYLKGDKRAWKALAAPPAAPDTAGRWVKLPSEQVPLEDLSLRSVATQLTRNASLLELKVEQAKLDGRQVVVLRQRNGSALYVANTGPAYPLRMDDKRPGGGRIEFAEYGADFHIAPPSNPLSNAMTAEETAWLGALDSLAKKMERAFTDSPTYLTSSSLASMADALRTCGHELTRIGPPSDRLQPVYALAKRACAAFDKGARCLATAAHIGTPMAGSAADRKFSQALDCGFASSQGSAPLTNAIIEGQDINKRLG